MTWAAPLWLLGLLPWAAVVLYLLWGRRRRTDVPFLDLWQIPAEGVRVRRRVSPPPLALALAILAMLLAVLAAGRPQVPWPGGGPTISVVIDRGYTMSARAASGDGDGKTRTAELIDRVSPVLRDVVAPDRIHRWVVPGAGQDGEGSSDVPSAPAQTPTAVDSRDALRIATRAALARNEGPAIVLSDQPLGFDDARVIAVPPEGPVRNARIVLLAARESPAVQVMVRVRGGAGIDRATVRVTSAGASAGRDVKLMTDQDVDAFIDLPRLGEFLQAELLVNDDQPGDDTAWLVREASWPRLETRAPLPPHVQRVVEVYGRSRPATDASRRVLLVRDAADLPAGEPGIVLVPASGQAGAKPGDDPDPLVVREHAITRGVAWAQVGSPATAETAPPAGWTPVVSAGGKVWVAVREQPIRAVWIGFEMAEWARSAEFVVFWANALNWAGAGGERFASYPVGALEGQWQPVELAESVAAPEAGLWPGLYRRSDGTLRALHAPDVPFPEPRETNWRARLAQLEHSGRGRLALAPALSLLALACLLLAAVVWKRRPGRPAGSA